MTEYPWIQHIEPQTPFDPLGPQPPRTWARWKGLAEWVQITHAECGETTTVLTLPDGQAMTLDPPPRPLLLTSHPDQPPATFPGYEAIAAAMLVDDQAPAPMVDAGRLITWLSVVLADQGVDGQLAITRRAGDDPALHVSIGQGPHAPTFVLTAAALDATPENWAVIDGTQHDADWLRTLGTAPAGSWAQDPEPRFVVRAQDNLAVGALVDYKAECQRQGLHEQAAQVQLALQEFMDWRRRNPKRCKNPDHQHVPATGWLS